MFEIYTLKNVFHCVEMTQCLVEGSASSVCDPFSFILLRRGAKMMRREVKMMRQKIPIC